MKTAIAWLERAEFLERNENHTRVFQGKLLVKNLEEAAGKIAAAESSPARAAPLACHPIGHDQCRKRSSAQCGSACGTGRNP